MILIADDQQLIGQRERAPGLLVVRVGRIEAADWFEDMTARLNEDEQTALAVLQKEKYGQRHFRKRRVD